jgi:hypothetical protein
MQYIKNLIKYFIGFIFTLLLFETILSFLPVSNPIRTHALLTNDKPFDVRATKSTILTFSTMSFFNNAIKRKTNSLGFFSDYEYENNASVNFIVGDSQVEAVQVRFSETFHQIIEKKTNKKMYNIGLSGAPISQYHAYVNEICERYKPTNIFLLIIPNDFKQSLKEHRIRNGWFHYDKSGSLKPTPYEISWYRALANNSSLIRYLYFNLRIGSLYNNIFRNYAKKELGEIKTLEEKKDIFFKLDKKAINIFFKSFDPNCVNKRQVLFILDANRYSEDELGLNVYQNGSAIASFEYFKEIAKKNDYDVLDLNEYFKKDYQKNSIKFEASKYDNHWGKYGHKLAAESILKYKKW